MCDFFCLAMQLEAFRQEVFGGKIPAFPHCLLLKTKLITTTIAPHFLMYFQGREIERCFFSSLPVGCHKPASWCTEGNLAFTSHHNRAQLIKLKDACFEALFFFQFQLDSIQAGICKYIRSHFNL